MSRASSKKTVPKSPVKKKDVSSVVASVGKLTMANAIRYQQNRYTYNAVSGMLSGNMGAMSYNSLISRSYGNLNRFLYD